MKEKEFHYQWWGKGDIDASLGIFFDGFSKVLTAVGILTAVFGIPMADVIGKVVPGIGISIFVGNMWYFFEACQLAKKGETPECDGTALWNRCIPVIRLVVSDHWPGLLADEGFNAGIAGRNCGKLFRRFY